MRRFAGIDLGAEPASDETTILRFRHLLEPHEMGEKLFGAVQRHLESRGLKLATFTIVDATIINAPSSTRNLGGKRDGNCIKPGTGQPVVLWHEDAHRRGQQDHADTQRSGDSCQCTRSPDAAWLAAWRGNPGMGR